MRHRALLPAAFAVAMAAGVNAVPAAEPSTVKLLVTVAVDSLSWPRLEEARPLLVGGLKRLLDDGRIFTACRYLHLNTETSPGHAALSTGAPPHVTSVGIELPLATGRSVLRDRW